MSDNLANNNKQGWNNSKLTHLYHENSGIQFEAAIEMISRINNLIPNQSSIIDYGCGDGKITVLILSKMLNAKSVLGLDISEEMLRLAKKKYYSYKNVNFMHVDKTDYVGNYDLITSFCVFHLIPEPVPLLEKFHSILNVGGKLCLVVPICNNQEFIKARNQTLVKFSDQFKLPENQGSNNSMRTVEDIKDKTVKVFGQVDISTLNFKYPYVSRESLITWCIGTLSANWNIPINLVDDFFKYLVDSYLELRTEDAEDEDGFVYLNWTYVYVIATKLNLY